MYRYEQRRGSTSLGEFRTRALAILDGVRRDASTHPDVTLTLADAIDELTGAGRGPL